MWGWAGIQGPYEERHPYPCAPRPSFYGLVLVEIKSRDCFEHKERFIKALLLAAFCSRLFANTLLFAATLFRSSFCLWRTPMPFWPTALAASVRFLCWDHTLVPSTSASRGQARSCRVKATLETIGTISVYGHFCPGEPRR